MTTRITSMGMRISTSITPETLPLLLASPARLDYDAANIPKRYPQHMRPRCTL